MKKVLILLHRYLGAALCLLFAVWFASGIAMVFVRFPALDEDRRLAALPELALGPALPSPAEAFARRPIAGQVRLGMLGARAVYRYVDGADRAGLLDAADTTLAIAPSADEIARLAASHATATAPATNAQPWPTSPVERRDQWTTMVPAAAQFPLRRFEPGDAAGTQVYVSLPTAEVVQVTTRRDRLWAWLGPIPHWIYPIMLRRHAELWRHVVLVVAGAGVLLCLSGLMIGIWHWRPSRWGWGRPLRDASGSRRASPYRASPYRDQWMRWHHYVGLAFGCLAFTWVGSGALSLNPFRWSAGSSPTREERLAFSGGPLQLGRFVVGPQAALAACRRQIRPRELELVQVGGHPYYLCRQSSRESRLVAAGEVSGIEAIAALTPPAILGAGRPLWGDRTEVTIPGTDDSYLDAGDGGRPTTTVLRIHAGENGALWYDVDRRTGQIVTRLGRSGRLERWLYHGFHSLDFSFLPRHSPIWYAVILALCGLGLFFSVTGIAVALGWLARTRRRRAVR